MKVDEDHANFEASPSEQEVWRLSPAEQRALEVGETANDATPKAARAGKRQKDAKTSKKNSAASRNCNGRQWPKLIRPKRMYAGNRCCA